jgi:molybdenum cofactor cytidylyltransferase
VTNRIGAVVMAAGSSSRLGTPKQVLPFGTGTLLENSVSAALNGRCSPVIVVTGAYAQQSEEAIRGLDVHTVFNLYWERGMASTIRVGIEQLLQVSPLVDACVLMVCDQPHVSAEIITRLIDTHQRTSSSVIASAYAGTFGVPALFDRSLFAELMALEGKDGAKQVMIRHRSQIQLVPFPDGAVDVDIVSDVAALATIARQT